MWTGRLPYGKCDIVPGELFVATEFQHMAWLPVIPIRSWVIVEGSIESSDYYVQQFSLRWDGVPIPFSLKSFVLAWIRTSLLVVGIAGSFYLAHVLLLWILGYQPMLATGVAVAVVAVVAVGYWLSLKLVHASPERAEQLRKIIARKYGSGPA